MYKYKFSFRFGKSNRKYHIINTSTNKVSISNKRLNNARKFLEAFEIPSLDISDDRNPIVNVIIKRNVFFIKLYIQLPLNIFNKLVLFFNNISLAQVSSSK